MFARFAPAGLALDPPMVVLGAMTLLLLVWVLVLGVRVRRLGRRFRSLLTSAGGVDLEGMLEEYRALALDAHRTAAASAERTDALAGAQRRCYQRSGVVRFDAFEDTGGRLSFSMALIDGEGDGVVVTSLYGRDSCRVYAKGLQQGASETALSREERDAVDQALSAPRLSAGRAS